MLYMYAPICYNDAYEQIAARQSKNVVIDLRRIKRNENKSLHEIEKEFNYSKNLERIKIITKGGRIIDLDKDI